MQKFMLAHVIAPDIAEGIKAINSNLVNLLKDFDCEIKNIIVVPGMVQKKFSEPVIQFNFIVIIKFNQAFTAEDLQAFGEPVATA